MKHDTYNVIIVGAGLTGIAASYYLARRGIAHIVLEKKNSVGGIWSALRWPGMRCDTEILNYSYSFKPYHCRHYLVSGEILSRYLESVARDIGLFDRLRLRTKVLAANFSSAEQQWQVHTDRGTFEARFLINANGYFSDEPYEPEFAGAGDFGGEITHLFRLHGSADLGERRIVVVGSGASAISAAPALAGKAASVTLLQRTPSYIYEQRNDVGVLVDWAQRMHGRGFAFPMKLVNYIIQLKYDLVFVLFRAFPMVGKAFFRLHWRRLFDKKAYAELLQPSYGPWEQRIPVGVGLKAGIAQGKIALVTGRIARFVPGGVVLEDGRRLDADMCILATGFNLKFFRFPLSLDHRVIRTEGINYYKGMMMGGIPNYFQPFGPPHTSFTRRIERVCALIASIVSHMEARGLGSVQIPRRRLWRVPRITPGYVMRSLAELPVIYGTFQLPSIDNWLHFRFRAADYEFQDKSRARVAKPGGWRTLRTFRA